MTKIDISKQQSDVDALMSQLSITSNPEHRGAYWSAVIDGDMVLNYFDLLEAFKLVLMQRSAAIEQFFIGESGAKFAKSTKESFNKVINERMGASFDQKRKSTKTNI